jgi:hypothetical protein
MQEESVEYLAECFWPGVRRSDLAALDQRAQAAAAESTRRGDDVRYLGSLLMRQDEVMLCRFMGTERAVRRVAEQAAVPFERIVAAERSPWLAGPPSTA